MTYLRVQPSVSHASSRMRDRFAFPDLAYARRFSPIYSNLDFLDTDLLCLKFASLAESRHCRIPSLRNAAIAECRCCEKLLLRKIVVVTFRYCRNVTFDAIQNKFSLIETELASCERKVSADAGRAYCRKSKRSDAGHAVACACDAF